MINPDTVYETLVKAADEWAECQYAADVLEKTVKSTYALAVERERTEQRLSVAAAEHIARTDKDYLWHCEQLAAANRNAIKAKARYYARQAEIDAHRTVEATHRATMARAS
jgi:hypothetical protein